VRGGPVPGARRSSIHHGSEVPGTFGPDDVELADLAAGGDARRSARSIDALRLDLRNAVSLETAGTWSDGRGSM
jgi:hypothetical protein